MIYEFRCGDCHKVSEVWMKMSDPNPSQCPACGSSNFERIISNTAFALKGTGWYTTDYKKSAPATASSTSTSTSNEKKEAQSAASPTTNCGQNATTPCGSGACTKPN